MGGCNRSELDALQPLSELDEREVWAMVEASPDGILLADEHGTILLVNAQIEALFGYDRGELLGRPVEDLLPEQHRQVHTAHRIRYRAAPTVRAMGGKANLRGLRHDGTEFPVEVSLSPVTGAGESRVVATVRDISNRVALDAHTHAVLHTIDEARDGVLMFKPDSLEFAYVNNGAVAQLGYTHDELLAMTPLHIKPEFTEASFRELLAPLVAGEIDSSVYTTKHRSKDGIDHPVEIILQYPPAGETGQPRMMVALVRDITERTRTEKELQDHRTRVEVFEDRERVARDLHDLVIQRLFAAGMGLLAVRPLIEHPRAAQRVDATVAEIDEAINELRTTIFKLNAPSWRGTAIELTDIIDNAEPGLGFRPSLTVQGDLETMCDAVAEHLLPTLTEALANVARHANATATAVTIDIDDLVELRVVDNGIGYHQLTGASDDHVHRTTTQGDDTHGHGLANLGNRAQRLGGTMTITGDPDNGTIFIWTAPNEASTSRPSSRATRPAGQ